MEGESPCHFSSCHSPTRPSLEEEKRLTLLLSHRSFSFDILSLSTLLPYLSSHILSEDSLIRQSSLLILSVVAPSSIVLQRCIELEDVPLTVRDAREKCLRVGKVARAVVALGEKPSKEGEVEIEVGVKILVGEFSFSLPTLASRSELTSFSSSRLFLFVLLSSTQGQPSSSLARNLQSSRRGLRHSSFRRLVDHLLGDLEGYERRQVVVRRGSSRMVDEGDRE